MSKLHKARKDPEAALWEHLAQATAVMLGPDPADGHMQPMAPQACAAEKTVFFFTSAASTLATSATTSLDAMVCLMDPDGDFQACLNGTLSRVDRPEIVDRFWSPVVGAWFDGKDDPELVLLAFRPHDAAIWASSDSSIRFGWEIAKANVTDSEPDIGFHTTLGIVQPGMPN